MILSNIKATIILAVFPTAISAYTYGCILMYGFNQQQIKTVNPNFIEESKRYLLRTSSSS